MKFSSNRIYFFISILLFSIYLVNGIVAISANSMVYDEMDNWSYSRRIMKGEPQIVYPYDDGPAMPIGLLNTIPRSFEQLTNPGLMKTDGGLSDVMNGRYMTLLFCMLTGVFIFLWSNKMFGPNAGLFSLFLFVFCPNLNANSILQSYDAYTALFTLVSFYYFWKFVKESGNKNFILFSLALALAQISKYSSIHFFIIFGILSLIVLIKRKTFFFGWKRNILRLLVLVSIVLLVINAGYLFYESGQPLSTYQFKSTFFQSLQAIPFINNIPLPLPSPYIDGFDITFHMLDLGPGNPLAGARNYLFGEFNTTGLWYYYPVIIFFKTPIPYLLIFISLLGLYIKKKKFNLVSTEFFIGAGLFYFLIVFAFLNNLQNSLRHIIFIYPLLYVLAGRLLQFGWKIKFFKLIISLFIIYSISTYYYFFPNLISYTNEFILDKKNAYKIMADTNLDYNQGEKFLKKYLVENRDVKLADSIPKKGRIIIGLNNYVDIRGNGRYQWLQQFQPIGHVNHCYLLFEIK